VNLAPQPLPRDNLPMHPPIRDRVVEHLRLAFAEVNPLTHPKLHRALFNVYLMVPDARERR
jgi:hypothetical protein